MPVKFRNISIYFILWSIVILLSLAGSFFNAVLLDLPFHIRQELPFLARWVVWLAITPFAINLAKNVKYADTSLSRFLLYHFSMYVLIGVVHIMLASGLASLVNLLLNGSAQYIPILIKCALTGVFYNFIVYAIIILLQNGLEYYRALQDERTKTLNLEKMLADTRLQFLKQQLQPHFLFNTHHSIIALMKLGEKEKAIHMMEKLSDLMRIALRESDDQMVTLNKEVEMLQLYLDIQKIRFEDKLEVAYHVAADTGKLLVPGMMLQPLVENSIKYAVERSVNKSSIIIGASIQDSLLNIFIRDLSANPVHMNDIKKGIGLSNAEERLHQLYGNNYQFSLQPYQNNGHSGTEVSITIPVQYANM